MIVIRYMLTLLATLLNIKLNFYSLQESFAYTFFFYNCTLANGMSLVTWQLIACVLNHFNHVQLCPTLCNPMNVLGQAPLSMGFSRQMGCHALLQQISVTQGLNPCLLHSMQILNPWATREAWYLTKVLIIRATVLLFFNFYFVLGNSQLTNNVVLVSGE